MTGPSARWAGFVRHPGAAGRLEVWERHENAVIGVLPYAMLTFATVITLVSRGSAGQPWSLDLALCVVTAAWLAARQCQRRRWGEREWAEAVFFTGLVLLMGLLVYRDPWFGFFTFTGYFYMMSLPSGWPRVAALVATATLTGTSQAGGFPAVSGAPVALWAGIVAVNLVVAGSFAWFAFVSHNQNERRKELVGKLSAANQRLETTLSENAGLHQQLLTQAREAGVLDERQRLAREIHDTLAQGLAGIITQLQAAEQAAQDPAARRRHVDAASRLARDSLTEARRSVDALRPQPLEQARLSEALASVAGRWSALHGIPAPVTVTGTARPMAADTELALLRTAQEALANVARHAAASRVGVTLSYSGADTILDVRDDGRGFDAARLPVRADAGGGFGLVAMRQRIEALAGKLQIESEPGAGTAVCAVVPFQAGETRHIAEPDAMDEPAAPLAGALP